jgi:hypothetical protein
MNPEFEELINSEGPQGMLQLMLQNRTNGIMTEENSDGDDYADWISGHPMQKRTGQPSVRPRAMYSGKCCYSSTNPIMAL